LLSGFIDATDVDLIGVMNTVAASAPHLEAGASVIITGSTAGLMTGTTEKIGASGGTGYMFAKRIVFSYVETVALQLAPHMIRLNGIHPTNCDTHLLHNVDVYRAFRPDLENPTREEAMVALPNMQAMPIPFIDPIDVSHLVAFLASDESRYMTGLNIRVDAGAMLKTPPT
jgi:NAD(P)-dependent dehydrogenase (short-subunit alcohol dehydrogenase family)